MEQKCEIEYHNYGDFSFNYYKNSVITFVNTFHRQKTYSLAELIEIHNISCYLGFDEISKELIDAQLKKFKKESTELLGKFFSTHSLEDIQQEYCDLVLPKYIDDFWLLFSKFNMIKKTTVNDLKNFIVKNKIKKIRPLLKRQDITKKYASLLKEILLSDTHYFELFIDIFDSPDYQDYNFPKNINSAEINDWAKRYCEYEKANSNYLKRLSQWSSHYNIKIDEFTMLLAQKKYNQQADKVFEESPNESSLITFPVFITPNINGIIEHRSNQLLFNKDYLDQIREIPLLLENLKSMFGFFNQWQQFSLTQNSNHTFDILDIIEDKSKSGYPRRFNTSIKKMMYINGVLAFYDYLHESDRDLEKIFETYLTDYFQTKYNNRFGFDSSNPNSNFYQRCKSLIPELDSLLKKFYLYTTYGEIDPEFLELSSKNPSYTKIKSLCPKKYIYINSDRKNIINVCQVLFDYNSMLAEEDTSNFFDLVNNKASFSNFHKYQQKLILDLKKLKVLDIDTEKDSINWVNLQKVCLYKLIWDRGYLSKFFLHKNDLKVVEEEVKLENLVYGDTLFSKQEMDYISFTMDQKMFNNGLDLRNKIIHGSLSNKKPEEYKLYYIDLLIILLLYTVKINEELEYESKSS